MHHSNFHSTIKFSSNRKGAKPYRSYLTPTGSIRWKQIQEFIQVRGQTYQLHITVEHKLRWIPVKDNNPPQNEEHIPTCNWLYCPHCDIETVLVDVGTELVELVERNCDMCNSETTIMEILPTALVPDQEMDENFTTIYMCDQGNMYLVYQVEGDNVFA